MKLLNFLIVSLLSSCIALLFSCAKANDPVSPEVVKNKLSVERIYQTQGYARDLDIQDSLLYIAEDQAGFSIYNLNSNQLLNRFFAAEFGNIRLVKKSGRYLFAYNVGASSTGILVYNIQNPLLPLKLFNWTGTTQGVTELFVEPDSVNAEGVLFSWVSGKTVCFDYQFKDFPTPGLQFAYNFSLEGFAKDNIYGYLASEQCGINIVRRDSGIVVGKFETSGVAMDVAVKNNLLFAALKESGIVVLNTQNPANPTELYHYNTSGYAQHLDCDGNYLAVASGGGGVYVFDVRNPQKISLIGNLEDSEIGYAYKVKIHAGFVYAATKTGLVKIKINL